MKNHWHVIMARKQREQSNLCGKRSFQEVFSNSSILNLPYTKGIGYENERFYDNTPSSSLASCNFTSVSSKQTRKFHWRGKENYWELEICKHLLKFMCLGFDDIDVKFIEAREVEGVLSYNLPFSYPILVV